MEQKNKGGRPTKTLSEKRKYQVLLRLNMMEYFTLQGKARGVSMHFYIESTPHTRHVCRSRHR